MKDIDSRFNKYIVGKIKEEIKIGDSKEIEITMDQFLLLNNINLNGKTIIVTLPDYNIDKQYWPLCDYNKPYEQEPILDDSRHRWLSK